MIPIECPKCGRGGNVPPDRLNARLVCKACHSVFHMDNSGKLMLGEPGNPDKKANRHAESSKAAADFDFAETWNKIPAPVKFGVPGVLLVGILWVYFGPGPGEPNYIQNTETIIRAVVANDRSRALSYASTGTADAAGKWFDMVRDAFTKKNVSPNSTALPTLWGGNPEKGSDIQMAVIVSDPATNEQFPMPINLFMSKSGTNWTFDGTRTLADAEKSLATLPKTSR